MQIAQNVLNINWRQPVKIVVVAVSNSERAAIKLANAGSRRHARIGLLARVARLVRVGRGRPWASASTRWHGRCKLAKQKFEENSRQFFRLGSHLFHLELYDTV